MSRKIISLEDLGGFRILDDFVQFMDKRMDGQTDRWMDGRTDGRTGVWQKCHLTLPYQRTPLKNESFMNRTWLQVALKFFIWIFAMTAIDTNYETFSFGSAVRFQLVVVACDSSHKKMLSTRPVLEAHPYKAVIIGICRKICAVTN